MTVLNPDDAIDRFVLNEERIDLFVNGTATQSYNTNEVVPRAVESVSKFMARKEAEFAASNVGQMVTDAQAARDAAQTSATNAATSATNASNSATSASTSATNAASSATAASNSATSASSSASSASTSATNASTSATSASTSATNAATSATNAQTAETNAETAQAAAEAARDEAVVGAIKCTGGGTANAQTATPTAAGAPTTLLDGMRIQVKMSIANTGAATLDYNATGAKSITTSGGVALSSGSLVADRWRTFIYNTTTTTWVMETIESSTAGPIKAFGAYSGNTGLYASSGIASVTGVGNGINVQFTTPFADANYVVIATCSHEVSGNGRPCSLANFSPSEKTASAFVIETNVAVSNATIFNFMVLR